MERWPINDHFHATLFPAESSKGFIQLCHARMVGRLKTESSPEL